MNTFAVVFLCVQACLVQNVYSQCGSYGAEVVHNSGFAPGLAAFGPAASLSSAANLGSRYLGQAGGVAAANEASYGGSGDGNVAVAGELPVVGNTGIIGQVPILGAVNFDGSLPAAGTVIIIGQCSCGCGY